MTQVIAKKLRFLNVPTVKTQEQENVQQLVITPEGKVRKKVIEKGNTLPPVDSRPFKVYTAFLNGTTSVSSSVLENTLGFIPEWSLVTQGMYEITNWDNSLNWSKTTMEAHPSINNNISAIVDINEDQIPRFIAYQIDQPQVFVNLLQKIKVEIRVYNSETTDS